jgi:hypothetical protein
MQRQERRVADERENGRAGAGWVHEFGGRALSS